MTDTNVTDLTRGVYRRQYGGYLKGRRINSISLEAEAWFWRLQAVVDDFGNIEADPELVWLATRGRRKGITVEQVRDWLREMLNAQLIEAYKAKGEHYVHIIDFEDIQPAGKNGKRLRKVPDRGTPEETKRIRVNPESTSASDNDNHTDTQDHSEDDNHTHPEVKTTTQPRAKRSAEQRGTRLPDDFQPSEGLKAWALREVPHVNIVIALDEFKDYWRARPGAGGRKLDWEATFRNRLRELSGRRNGNGRPPTKSKADLSIDAGMELIAELEAKRERDRHTN